MFQALLHKLNAKFMFQKETLISSVSIMGWKFLSFVNVTSENNIPNISYAKKKIFSFEIYHVDVCNIALNPIL
jgi:hypothetical protein